MQTAMHPAFAEKLAMLAVLLERGKTLRAEAREKIGAPRFQVKCHGHAWDVVDVTTGAIQGFAFTYQAALRFASAMEAGAATKRGVMQ
ncbi:hypothetical protein [Pantoea sp. Cy-639]|uniref:hypothetical protein n=1 Tax=Pantoea sp. Cy-639 TaxID=2608360 RepID=UPI00141D8FC2|nr:hypothetical protein [Pantoea sp. Cy-639]NIF15660.1 hypothetical protein [Pantoea sp. Cy-639]